MQALSVQRIYKFSREQYLYLITSVLVCFWIYWATDYFIQTYQQSGSGVLLFDEINQLYLMYAVTPAVYAWYRSALVQEYRVLRFALKSYLGLMLTMSVLFGMVFSYLITGTNG